MDLLVRKNKRIRANTTCVLPRRGDIVTRVAEDVLRLSHTCPPVHVRGFKDVRATRKKKSRSSKTDREQNLFVYICFRNNA